MDVPAPGPDAAERTYVDNTAAAVSVHPLRSLLAAKERGFQVYAMDEIPIGFGDLERIEFSKACRIVDQAVELAEALVNLLKEIFDLADLFEVRVEDWRVAALGRGLAGLPLRAVVMNGNARAFAMQTQSNPASDALRRAGDQHDGAF